MKTLNEAQIRKEWNERVKQEKLARGENPQTHIETPNIIRNILKVAVKVFFGVLSLLVIASIISAIIFQADHPERGGVKQIVNRTSSEPGKWITYHEFLPQCDQNSTSDFCMKAKEHFREKFLSNKNCQPLTLQSHWCKLAMDADLEVFEAKYNGQW